MTEFDPSIIGALDWNAIVASRFFRLAAIDFDDFSTISKQLRGRSPVIGWDKDEKHTLWVSFDVEGISEDDVRSRSEALIHHALGELAIPAMEVRCIHTRNHNDEPLKPIA